MAAAVKRFAGTRGHLEQKAVVAVFHSLLKCVDCPELIGAQEAQVVGLNESCPLVLVLPRSFRGIVGTLTERTM